MDADDTLHAGAAFGRYRLLEMLGEGAVAVVWKAVHIGLKKPVVIKVLKLEHARNALVRNRFLREGEAASRIVHPHVVEVHDVGLRNDRPYLVMEFLEGEDLYERLRREGALPLRHAADILVPVCAAVSAAHEEGVVHRDIKPENIFLAHSREGDVHPKVLDFGISRVVDDTSSRIRTQTATLLGTPLYMSPEQARGERSIDDRSDQYSLGVVLYEASTGAPPFSKTALYDLLDDVVNGRFRLPRAVRPELPSAFERVILRAMALLPDERFPSVRALGAELLPYASEKTRLIWSPSFTSTLSPLDRTRVDPQPDLLPCGPASPGMASVSDTLTDPAPPFHASSQSKPEPEVLLHRVPAPIDPSPTPEAPTPRLAPSQPRRAPEPEIDAPTLPSRRSPSPWRLVRVGLMALATLGTLALILAVVMLAVR